MAYFCQKVQGGLTNSQGEWENLFTLLLLSFGP
jgi:hypothetical protein